MDLGGRNDDDNNENDHADSDYASEEEFVDDARALRVINRRTRELVYGVHLRHELHAYFALWRAFSWYCRAFRHQ